MLELLLACAPDIHPVTAAAIVQQESGGSPWALNDNTGKKSYRPKSAREAAEIASRLVAAGHSVDIGIAQINSRNLPALKLSIEQVLDPCTNLRASQTILKEGFQRAGGNLAGALSAYNTGKTTSSVGAKYADSVYRQAGAGPVVPAIPGGTLAPWVTRSPAGQAFDLPGAGLPPARVIVIPSPAASPFSPAGGGFTPGGMR